jgi:hypothetical protein
MSRTAVRINKKRKENNS